MPSNTPAYVEKNKPYLNKRYLISYHNRILKLDYETIHAYEAIHGIDKTILWLKEQKYYRKYNLNKNP
jgi:hypothetical protein